MGYSSPNVEGKVSNPTLPAALNSNSGNKGYDLKTKLTICIPTQPTYTSTCIYIYYI